MPSSRVLRPATSRAVRLALAVVLTLVLAAPALAHRSNVFAWEEGGQIKLECSFSGGKPCKGAPVTVEDAASGKELLTVHTDDQGMASFAIPEAARAGRLDLLLVLHAGEGHQGDWTLKADEYLGQAAAPQAETAQAPAQGSAAAEPWAAGGAALTLDEAALERVVDKALDKRLGPINRRLAALAEGGPTVSDIVGGIGWILGLFGVAALVRGRRA